ncbi:hypothetical protein AMELA_G00063260 [Ameiurus melas]|uniref:Uncharacterized protein n=1 Tax=Ameiurus melas TaxID=219545 RepID=A0A7J6B435_AMEME|nr:hypothetical protein AMELA_G00063260 [Ameiurus melas]
MVTYATPLTCSRAVLILETNDNVENHAPYQGCAESLHTDNRVNFEHILPKEDSESYPADCSSSSTKGSTGLSMSREDSSVGGTSKRDLPQCSAVARKLEVNLTRI